MKSKKDSDGMFHDCSGEIIEFDGKGGFKVIGYVDNLDDEEFNGENEIIVFDGKGGST